MSARTETSAPAGAPPSPTAVGPEPRPLFWSVRRELWENRSVVLAPLVVTAFVLLGSAINVIGLPRRLQALATDPARLQAVLVQPFDMAPAPIMLATFLVGMFYAIDALYGERRDRSILFWKSLPVSDRTTVLSKASIPLVILPLTGFVLSVATLLFLLLLASAVLAGSGMSAAGVWAGARLIQQPIIMFYGLAVHTLWFAPLYAWLLLVSAWARRAPLLWAASPLLLLGLEHAVGGSLFGSILKYRFAGAMEEAFASESARRGHVDWLWQLDPVNFLTTPGLWLGLLFAAACLASAVRLRRNREPI